jgi:transcriptional regulator with XRE-family HTH domain
MFESDAPQFAHWLKGELDFRRWSPNHLARRSGITLTQILMVLKGERRAGDKFLRAVAEAFQMPQVVLFRLAGLINDTDVEQVREREAARKLDHLLSALSPQERDKAIHLLETYVRDHTKDQAAPSDEHGQA